MSENLAESNQDMQNYSMKHRFMGGGYGEDDYYKRSPKQDSGGYSVSSVDADDDEYQEPMARHASSDSDAPQRLLKPLIGEDAEGSTSARRPQGAGETVREPGDRSWKRDEIWNQVKAADGESSSKPPQKINRTFGDHMKSFGKGLASFGAWVGMGFGALPLLGAAWSGVRGGLAKSGSMARDAHLARAKSRLKTASGYQWRKRIGNGALLPWERSAQIDAIGLQGEYADQATWRDARDAVQGRFGDAGRHDPIKSDTLLASDHRVDMQARAEQISAELGELKTTTPTSLTHARELARRTQQLRASQRQTMRATARHANFDKMSTGDSEEAQKKAAFAKPKWAASPAPIIEEEASENSDSEEKSNRAQSVGSPDGFLNQQMLQAYSGRTSSPFED